MTTGQNRRQDEPDDVYRDLPPELIATLRDPRIVLPGEFEAFDSAAYYDGNPPSGIYAVGGGQSITPSTDTPNGSAQSEGQ